MGSAFRLVSAAYILDGIAVFERTDESGELDKRFELLAFSGSIRPGPHHLTVRLVYRAKEYRLFSYLEAYQIKIESNHDFSTAAAHLTTVKVVHSERPPASHEGDLGDLPWAPKTLDLKHRPQVRYEVESVVL